MTHINEAEQKEFMTKREEAVKRQLIALLKDDGLGHHHAFFAEKLKDFILKITPEAETASMDYEHGIIRVNPGFINVPPLTPEQKAKGEKFPPLFRQLNVLMRHELAHALMKHQIRMEKTYEAKYGKEAVSRIMKSKSMHEIENIITDFEISNRRYTDEDKETVRNMWLNGELIGGLVTEEHRKNWQPLKLEEMYEAINEEAEEVKAQIIQALKNQDTQNLNFSRDIIKHELANSYYYFNISGESNFASKGFTLDIVQDFINNKALYHFLPFDSYDKQGNQIMCIVKASSIWPEWVNLVKNLHDGLLNTKDTKELVLDTDIDTLLATIVKSSIATPVKLKHPHTGEIIEILYSPEEKLLAVDTLKEMKNINKLYEIWFEKVKQALANPKYTEADLKELEDMLK